MSEIRVYFEGHPRLRAGFHAFLSEVIHLARGRCRFHLIATRGSPAHDYRTALRQHPDAWNILLLDSDRPDSGNLSAELCQREGLDAQHARSVFWMVQLMETWFLTDTDALASHYGRGFNREALPRNPRVEEVPKKDVCEGIQAATRGTRKGEYHKTLHAPDLLAAIHTQQVEQAAPNCRRMMNALRTELAG